MIKQMTSEELKNLILHGNKEIIKEVLENIHPADILDILHEDEDSSKEILEHLPNEVIGDILDEEDDEENEEDAEGQERPAESRRPRASEIAVHALRYFPIPI